MKEIKFRAWIIEYGTKKGRMYPWDDFFFSDMSPVTGYTDEFPTNDPDVILMQFTNKTDMNGVDIYEDDIIYKETCAPDDPAYGFYGAIGVIKEDPHAFGWYIEAIGGDDDAFYDHMDMNFSFDDIKVIGNIYENPDLLGK